MSDRIQAKLDRLAQNPPISIDEVDFTINNPARLAAKLGRTFSYFARVEHEIAADPLVTMLPKLGTTYVGYQSYGRAFLDVWISQEFAHGEIFDRLQHELGLTPAGHQVVVTGQHKFMGALGKLSDSIHMVFEMIYLSRGAMHERLTVQGYELMGKAFENLSESALLETIIKPILRQEVGHLGYYMMASKELKLHLQPWQQWLVRNISRLTYKPVGAQTSDDEIEFGHVATVLAGEQLDEICAPVQAVAQELLTREGKEVLPKFVQRAIKSCVEAQAYAA